MAHARAVRTTLSTLTFCVAWLLASGAARAVPVFARKYETSCQTCHVAAPKLTPFGEAFRRNGHRFPNGEEESAAKQESVALGHEAHKRVFPKAIWPGDVPSAAPLSAQLASSASYEPAAAVRPSFASIGASLGLNVAATLGERISAWAGAFVRTRPGPAGGELAAVSLERTFFTWLPFAQPWALLRVGRIEPEAAGFTTHRTLGFAPQLLSAPIGDNPFALEPSQVGAEASGVVVRGRLSYAAGLVEGANGVLNSSKDVYGRLAYKVGGMRLDGVGGATDTEPWREKSATLGAFGYRGRSQLGTPGEASQQDSFWIAGADLNLLFKDANLQLVAARRDNRRPLLARPNEPRRGWQFSSQLDYVVYPWLIPTARYERWIDGERNVDRVSAGVYVLLRAHVRAQVLASATPGPGAPGLDQVLAGLNLAF